MGGGGGKGQQQAMQSSGFNQTGANPATGQSTTPWTSQQAWMSPSLQQGQQQGQQGMMAKGGGQGGGMAQQGMQNMMQQIQQKGSMQPWQKDFQQQPQQSGAMGIENVQSGTPNYGQGYQGPQQGGGYAQPPAALTDWLRNNGWAQNGQNGGGAAAGSTGGGGGTGGATTPPAPATQAPAAYNPRGPEQQTVEGIADWNSAKRFNGPVNAEAYAANRDLTGLKNWETFRFKDPADQYGQTFNALMNAHGPGAAYRYLMNAGGGQGRTALENAWGVNEKGVNESGDYQRLVNTMGLLSGPGWDAMGLGKDKIRQLTEQGRALWAPKRRAGAGIVSGNGPISAE